MTQDRFIQSADGTRIHVRTSGAGPGLVLVHGGVQTAGALASLAQPLGDVFTVHCIDRRGRRPSGPAGERYCMQREVEDLGAVLEATGARQVFGLSTGALIALRTALEHPQITRIALYEPPLEVAGAPSPLACLPACEQALAVNDKADALAALLNGVDDPSWMTRMPRFVRAALFRLVLAVHAPGSELPLGELIPTLHQEMVLAREMAGTVERYRALPGEVLLMGGERSRSFFARALDALAGVLPRASRVCLKGTGHGGPTADGAPERVALELQRFFAAPVAPWSPSAPGRSAADTPRRASS